LIEGLKSLEENPASILAKFPDVWLIATR